MDVETKLELIRRAPTEEIIGEEELKQKFETGEKINAYIGFEPSGKVHLGTGLITSFKMKDFIDAGINLSVYLASWHAWINRKLGGDMEKINTAADHFRHAFISLGIPENKVKFIKPQEEYIDIKYWEKTIAVARELTIPRAMRTIEIMGRQEAEAVHVSDLVYTPMQVADIFHFNMDIAYAGMDQRKAHVVAREVGEKTGFWKPICVHSHLLQGLATPPIWPLPSDPDEQKQMLASIKMSKSKPDTCIFIYDSIEDIKRKMNNAFCPAKETKFNPVLDMVKHIVFREKKIFEIKRPEKFGGSLQFENYSELEKVFADGKLHPMDLKNATADVIADILTPVRNYFEKNQDAKKTLEMINEFTITR